MLENCDNLNTVRHCQKFLNKKKRFCRILVKKNETFCCEHQPLDLNTTANVYDGEDSAKKLRIPCPFDNKHTCYLHKLNKHLKICNAKPKESQPFIVSGINSGSNETQTLQETVNVKYSLNNTPIEEINQIMNKIEKIYELENVNITEKLCTHDLVEKELKDEKYGIKTRKHLSQISSILGLLRSYELIDNSTCFIEFGAGRGALSFWLKKAAEDAGILLVERDSPKHKRDNKLDKSENKIQRIRADISSLVLDEVELVNQSQSLVGITKHLCGAATDFSIRCMENLGKNKSKLNGFLMTFCCHHRCTWNSFVGKEYFERIGLNEKEFQIMCCMVSWATCGTGKSRTKSEAEEVASSHHRHHGLNADQRKEIGLKCKNLMNWGRLKFINERMGFETNLHYYVKSSTTLENVCIVGKKRN